MLKLRYITFSIIIISLVGLLGCQRRAPLVGLKMKNPIRKKAFPIRVNQYTIEPVGSILDKPNQPQKAVTLKVLTLNVWGLPGFLGKDRKKRLQRIAKAIQGYDIVNLQETFSTQSSIIAEKSGYPYQIWHRERKLHPQPSGLFTLSKYPIKENKFKPFKHCYGGDCFSYKGALLSRIEHPTLGLIDVYNTHYQSSNMKSAIKVRMKANKTFQEFVQENDKDYPTIITGDFNMLPNKEEYIDLKKRLPLVDTFMSLHPTLPGYTFDPSKNPYVKSKAKRLDYVFVKASPRAKVLSSVISHNKKYDGYMLSDHFGVTSEISFSSQK